MSEMIERVARNILARAARMGVVLEGNNEQFFPENVASILAESAIEASGLVPLLQEAREEMAMTNHDQHPYRNEYPDHMRRYKRDMDLCYRIDEALK